MISTPRRPMKRSEHQWLGDIPTDWLVVDLKHLTRFINGAAFAPTDWGDEGVPIIRIVNLNGGDEFNYTKREVDPRYIVRTNDLLFGWSGNRGTSFGPFIWRREGVHLLNQHIFRLEGYDLDKAFFYWLLKAVTAHVESQVSGIIGLVHITKEDLGNIAVPVPSPSEQRAIAAFLDRKTAEIDAVIARKEWLIALLQEERQALISRAVTRGLDAGADMKDSGMPWLGEVPKHWHIVQLKFLAQIQTGITLGKVYDEPTKTYPYLRVANVQDGSFQLDEITEISVPANEAARSRLQTDDVLMTEGGDLDKLGRGSVWKGQIANCLHQNHVFAVRPVADRLVPEFLAYLTKASHGREYFTLTGQRTTNLASTNTTKVGAFPIPLPPLAEQQEICSYVDRATSRIDGLVHMNNDQITKLREYRQALISAAVTGKLAVPQEVPVVAPVEPAKKPNPYFRRSVFAAEIIDQLCEEPTFGHVKFQKCLYVAQYHLGITDFEENYYRQAAGPYDNQMIRSVDSQLTRQKWFEAKRSGERYTYLPLEKAGQHRKYFDGYFADQAEALTALLNLFRKMDTEQAEIVATLYAVWNDFLLLGEPFDDDDIVRDVLTNWHESKQTISEDRWRKALLWMRQKSLVPRGFGKQTRVSRKAGGAS